MRAHALEAKSGHGTPQLVHRQPRYQVAADGLQDLRRTDKIAAFVFTRQTVVLADQLTFRLGHLEPFVVARHQLHLPVVEPVAEAPQIESVRLGEDRLMVEGMIMRALDALHLERQPAARGILHAEGLKLVTVRHPELRFVGNHIMPEQDHPVEEFRDVLLRGMRLPPIRLVPLSPPE